MADQPENPGELSAGGVALLDAWLRGQGGERPADAAAVDVAVLVHYLAGALPAEPARAAERRLVADPAARQQLRHTASLLDAFQAIPWREVAAAGAGEDFRAQVARAWLALAAEQVEAAARARSQWPTAGWAGVRQQMLEGVAEARAAWTAFTAFGRQLQAELQLPRLAPSRGAGPEPAGAERAPRGDGPVITEAEVTHDGALRLAVAAPGPPAGPAPGAVVQVALALHGETWPVAAGILAEGRAAWDLPGMGSALGLSPGPIPLVFLQVRVGSEADAAHWPEASGPPWPLLAWVVDAAGAERHEPPAVIELLGLPRWETGQFAVLVALPDETRAVYADHYLELELVLSPRQAQRLGSWPVSEWEAGPRRLTCPCPGAPDATAPFVSLLRARLRPAASGG